ncbi:hypothetical protein A3E45_03715 [Candidatus Daviesbacteria bacterium RIFCSPHIGHO2_12_FULL_43_11]|uniref:Uncharacterized protein n=1 Tax=Candidatus Daviesbacteria bacterium RIFCSPHIGHO2_12_FULL_43_11 TaxID=1797780 RepID=A0A1F5K392_9BACT|nr:MAG: hypothetical protein A3E45_03715 [Candidatus Daviesbacteria bacterium RIFCSPHIGHO2_12_FULL_43_11]
MAFQLSGVVDKINPAKRKAAKTAGNTKALPRRFFNQPPIPPPLPGREEARITNGPVKVATSSCK